MLAAGAVLLAAAGSTRAAIITYTVDGTISGSTDQTGVFGPAGGSLDGDRFHAVVSFDTSIGLTSAADNQDVKGGSSLGGSTSPVVFGSLTINGRTFSSNGQYLGEARNFQNGYFGDALVHAEENQNSATTSTLVEILADINGQKAPTVPAVLDQPFTVTSAGNSTFGYFEVYENDFLGKGLVSYAKGTLVPETITETLSAAPEPSTWSLMILGVGGIGAALRARRRKAVAA